MREHMARILCLFEQRGAKNLVRRNFGTGVYRNDAEVVAKVWAALLIGSEARYTKTFYWVVFPIFGSEHQPDVQTGIQERWRWIE